MRRLIHPDLGQRLIKGLLILLTALTLSVLLFIITSLLLTGLAGGTTYYYQVESADAAGNSEAVNISSVTVDNLPPSATLLNQCLAVLLWGGFVAVTAPTIVSVRNVWNAPRSENASLMNPLRPGSPSAAKKATVIAPA